MRLLHCCSVDTSVGEEAALGPPGQTPQASILGLRDTPATAGALAQVCAQNQGQGKAEKVLRPAGACLAWGVWHRNRFTDEETEFGGG